MIGVFDSGEGGENAVKHLRRLAPRADIVLFSDRANLPYGTKPEDELVRLTERGIARLSDAGCERVLIACCTASTVHGLLPEAMQGFSIPIIEPTARAATALSRNGKISLIATEATVRSGAFGRELGERLTQAIAAGPLVDWVESGASSANIPDELGRYLYELAAKIAAAGTDTLILGCTHFAALGEAISLRLQRFTKRKILTVDSSESGALEMLLRYPETGLGDGRLYRI